MKIGFFTDGYFPQVSGVSTSIRDLTLSLTKMDNQITVVAPGYPTVKVREKGIIRLKSVRFYKPLNIRLAYMFPDKNFRHLYKLDFDIYHGFSGGPITSLGLALARIKKKPYVFTYNTRWNKYTHYLLRGKIVRPKAIERIMRLYCNRCDAVVAPTDFIKKELLSFGVKKPITVIPNGIDVNRFCLSKSFTTRKKLGIKKSDKVILYLGRLGKEKSVDFIIKSFKKISVKHPDSYLIIAGDGPLKVNLEKLAVKLGLKDKVFFLGFVSYEDVPNIYREADIFAFASKTETQGMVILEAMSSGLPVVAVGETVYEEFIENGMEGILVEKNISSFARELDKLLRNDNLRKTIGENAREKAEKFSLEKVAEKFEDLYISLL